MSEPELQRTVWVSSEDGRNSDMVTKVITIGTSNVGKTSLLARFVNDSFSSRPETTISVDFFPLNLLVRDLKVRFLFWDTAGQDHMTAIVKTYLRDANLTLFVFDLTDEKSFIDLKHRIEKEQMVIEDCVCALIGTKFDLFERLPSSARERQLFSQENMNKLAAELGFLGGAHQVSSLSKYNVEKTLLTLLDITVEFMQKNAKKVEKESLTLSRTAKPSSGCCSGRGV